MKNEYYKGFKIIRYSNSQHPDLIKAVRFGVELSASDIITLKAVIDNHIADNEFIRQQWQTERKG